MDKLWYYTLAGTQQSTPVTEEELRYKLQTGAVKATDLAWTDGMAEWKPISTLPEFAGPAREASATTSPAPAVAAATTVRPSLGGWITFVGIMNLLGGAFLVFTCVGIPLGILMVLAGVAAMGANSAMANLPAVPPEMTPVLDKLRSYFAMTGWVLLLQLILPLILFVLYIAGMAAAFTHLIPQAP